MRHFLLASFSFFLLLGTSCRKNNSDSDLPLGGRLDSITTRNVSDNSLLSGTKYNYDNADNLVQCFVNSNITSQTWYQFRYDAQNRLTAVSRHGVNYVASVDDTLVYSSTGHIVRYYRNASGGSAPIVSRAYVLDNNNRLILDSVYSTNFPNTSPYARYYIKFSYDAADNIQSAVVYGFNPVSPSGYTPQDSLAYTCDRNENPYYKYSFVIYSSGNAGVPFSKHNIVSSTRFTTGSTQPGAIINYRSTYYRNGLLRIQQTAFNASSSISDYSTEFLYR